MHCKVLIWPEKERETAAACSNKNKTVPKKNVIQKPTLKNKIQERKEVKSAHGRSTNLGSALVVLFQLTRKRCERARLKQQQETGSKNRQQTGFTQLYVCVCVVEGRVSGGEE